MDPPSERLRRPPLGYLLRQAAAAHRLRMDRALAGLDITPPQLLILTMVAENAGTSNAELARTASLTTPTVSVIVANLKRRGALRSRPHAVHGRVLHLDVTEAGLTLLAACRERTAAVEADLESGMTSIEVDAVRRWLWSAARDRVGDGAAPSWPAP